MNIRELLQAIPDTRPYPETASKNELLRNAQVILSSTSDAQISLARQQLKGAMVEELSQNRCLALSVALAMAANPAQYRLVWENLCEVLSPCENEVQWLALPVVLVIGAKQDGILPNQLPLNELRAIWSQSDLLKPLIEAQWIPHLISSETLTAVSAENWFQAKQNQTAAKALADSFLSEEIHYHAGQQTIVVYALAYGEALKNIAGKSLQSAALPLMQVWQNHFAGENTTIFTNPLSGNLPARALCDANSMRQRMACDVFTANAIRSIRLQHPRVGVVIAAATGGVLQMTFHTTESSPIPPMTFNYQLAPEEEIPLVVQNFLDLLAECRIEYVRILTDTLPEKNIYAYEEAQNHAGANPFFMDE